MNPEQNAKESGADIPEIPGLEQTDWDAVTDVVPESVPENGDLRYASEDDATESLEEDDDNPYQESDEALPDDDEEAAITRELAEQEGGRPDV